ncbi:S8 family peptidase [uncultured Chryseobacterium sp.]|uniref:S8 family peptidase n=2 Tax=uncultured Chryseobacterium sp. TaxID=259322 RepID=UPI0025FDD12B|nr:S8 family peptidase [uncultured Chryseobacterium sp.]
MKKYLLTAAALMAVIVQAQDRNAVLQQDFAKQNQENNHKFDAYAAKKYGNDRSPELLKKLEEKRSNLAGFMPDGKPYFYRTQDLRQVKNANADLINTTGGVTGLTNAYNGEGIKYTIFDGGRVYAPHPAFNNIAGRITNKEASTQIYSSHSTSVAGFIGAKSLTINGTIGGTPVSGDIKGVASSSTMDSYRFATTTLPGNTSSSTVFDKILSSQPVISNHSYGSNLGWDVATVNGANALVWNGAFVSPSTSYDLQGTYFTNDQNYDNIVYQNPSYVIVKSAGNSYGTGPDDPNAGSLPKYYEDDNGNDVQFAATDVLPQTNCALGFDCIGPGSLAKNIIIVGATDVIATNNFRYTSAADVVHSDYSSAGPRDDGAIKPDIATTGTDVFSPATAENTTGSVTYDYGSGTSYSAPVVTGVIGLWMQISKDLFSGQSLNAASAKTLMVHSASEAGNVGPDPWFGWGYINAKKGAELLVGKANNTVIFKDETLTSGTVNAKNVIASGSEPIKATISWIDPAYVIPSGLTWQAAYNNRSSRLINDLDLRIIDTTTNTVYYPWKLDANNPMTPATKADNKVDNIEQVVIDNPVAGRKYRIEISNKGTLVNNSGTAAPQNYSVIVTGFSQVLGTTEIGAVNGGIAVAPSVTRDIVNIIKAPEKSVFAVYDTSGKKLQSGSISNSQQPVNLSTYPKGVYIIEIKTGQGIVSKKVIKE